MDSISFQKIFGLYGLERHIVEKRWGVTLVHGRRTTECEDRARILKQNSQSTQLMQIYRNMFGAFLSHILVLGVNGSQVK